jgi:hypothetical protein
VKELGQQEGEGEDGSKLHGREATATRMPALRVPGTALRYALFVTDPPQRLPR